MTESQNPAKVITPSNKLLLGFVAWSWAILFSFASLGAFIEGSIFGGLLILASAACAFPPLYKHALKAVPRAVRVILAPTLLMLGIVVSPRSDNATEPKTQLAAISPATQKIGLVPDKPITAIFSLAAVAQNGGMLLTGRTTLPFGTQMLVSIEKPNGRLAAQDKTYVGEFGRFYTNVFTAGKNALPDGSYVVFVTPLTIALQPNEVKNAAGQNWANYVGPLMQSDKLLGRTPEAHWRIHWQSAGNNNALLVVLPSHTRYPAPNVEWAVSSLHKREAAAEAVWSSHREDAYYACRSLIRKNLRDPDSADFMTEYAPGLVTKSADNDYHVVQRVRAANGFGGKTVSIFVCETHLSGGNWHLDSIKELN